MHDVFRGGGEVGADLSAVDWESTPLGSPDEWPQSLRTVVNIVLTSRFSMWMAWGPELTFFCNEAYRRDTLARKYPWALGRPATEVWSEIWPDIGPRIETVMRTGQATWDEALQLFLERSGYVEETYHTFSYSPLVDEAGQVSGMLCVVSEDTQQVISARRMETLRLLGSRLAVVGTEAEGLAAAQEHLAANPRSLPFTLTYLFDEDGTSAHLAGSTGIAAGHPAAPDTLPLEATTWPVADLAEGRSTMVDDLADRFAELPTGVWKKPPTHAFLVPFLAGPGRPLGFLVVGLNRYRPVDASYRSFVELVAGQLSAIVNSARAYDTERQRAEELQELDRAKTAFFTNVSHEFRTPLTLLLGPTADALADPDHPLPEQQRHRLEVVERNGQRLLNLVNTLLDFSRLESERFGAHFEPVDLSLYTRDLASMFESSADRAGLSLDVAADPLPEPVFVDREMWAKIVLNLLSNAIKFTFEGGIAVRVSAEPDAALLTVTDTGIGIERAEVGHLFERFHRVPGARSRTYEGSGIGLALVAQLVEQHGGTAGVQSAPGEGSTFTVRLPWGPAHLPQGQVTSQPSEGQFAPAEFARGFLAEAERWVALEQPPAHVAITAPGVGAPARPRVLVVDDNSDMRDYIAELLSTEYVVETAVDGKDALRRARAAPPDLVLTDVMMPNLDGFGLMTALQQDPLTTGTPVIMLSARAGEEGTIEGLSAGADDYLVKPFAARELLARVRSNLELDRARRTRDALERSQQLLDHAQRLAHVGSWEVDLATGELDATPEHLRLIGREREDLEGLPYPDVVTRMVHPEERAAVAEVLDAGLASGGLSFETRLLLPDGGERLVSVNGEVVCDEENRPVRIRGSMQDVTEQRRSEQALALAAAQREAAFREHQIADQLQRSLLPERAFDPDHLDVATYYRAGVEGTQVGGDWYDVIELGAGRTALVVGDVMGRGVQAAAVMGQLRSAIRAYARLDLPPADVLESIDGMVRELGDDQIVTCVYAVFDPNDRTLTYANAGHLPPLLTADHRTVRLVDAASPPLGAALETMQETRVEMPAGTRVVLYTDGLVEQRGRDIDLGIEELAHELDQVDVALSEVPEALVEALLPTGPDDDVAVLVASVEAWSPERSATRRLPAGEAVVAHARTFVAEHLERWGVSSEDTADVVLMTSELVTNAVRHGRPPVDLRIRCNEDDVVLEVEDGDLFRPRNLRPSPDDEYGRGIQIVSRLAARWGTRATRRGKCVWAILPVATAVDAESLGGSAG